MEDKKTYVIKDMTTDEIIGVLITDKNSSEVYNLTVKANQLAYDLTVKANQPTEEDDSSEQTTTAFKSLLSEEDIFTEGVFVYYM